MGPEVIDPVCGMSIRPEEAAGRCEHQGTTYFFCNPGCLEQFRRSPEAFLSPRDAGSAADTPPAATPHPAAEWTCPMHPEIRRDEPGACPICGMALEPTVATLDDRNPELDDMTRRLRWSLAFTAPILAVMLGELLPGEAVRGALSSSGMTWFQLALATPVVLWGGWPFFARGWASIVNRRLNMFTLIALGVGAAYAFSVVATLAPGLFPASFRTHGEMVGVYFEAAAVIVVLVLLGQVLELRARSRTSGAIRRLLGLTPTTARRVDETGVEQDVPLAPGPGRRSPAGAARDARSGGWHPDRGWIVRRRIDGHGRADARGEERGRPAHRRHGQRHRDVHHGSPAGGE